MIKLQIYLGEHIDLPLDEYCKSLYYEK